MAGANSGDLSPPQTGTPQDRSGLIHAIYRIALEPQSYDVFMDHWNDHVSRAIDALNSLQETSEFHDGEMLDHFQTALGILEELGRRPATPLHEGEGVRLLLDSCGRVVWHNGEAARSFRLSRTADIEALEPHLSHGGTLRKLVSALDCEDEDPAADQCLLRHHGVAGDSYLLARRVRDRNGKPRVLIEPLLGDWPSELDGLLAESFGLTDAETRIAGGLAEGLTATTLAQRRGVSVLTVRAQIRALLAKTGAASQTDLVRLLVSVARAFDRTRREDADSVATPALCVTAQGREVPIGLMGPAGGAPVVFLHGMLDGCSATSRIEAALERAGLRLIAPVRPGFGPARPDRGPPATAAQRSAEDLEGVLDRLRLDRVVVLGHMAGALYAFAAAARLQQRVLGIVNVAGTVPIVSRSQFACMSRRQRLVAYTARYAPAALPFVLRAGIRQLDFGGERSFMTALYENSPSDLAAIDDPEIFRSLGRGYRFTVARGHQAFATDGYQVVQDWSDLATASDVPVTLMHGRADPVVSAESVSAFALRLGPRAKVKLFENSGQLLFYRAPEAVCEALRRYAAKDAAPPRDAATTATA